MPNTPRNYEHPILTYGDAARLAQWSGLYSAATIAEYLRRPRSKMPARFRRFMAGLLRRPEAELFAERR